MASNSALSTMPSLLDLCCAAVDRLLIINLDNALDVLQYAQTHDLEPLAQRAKTFIRNSWTGLSARHTADNLRFVVGQEEYEAMAQEADAISRAVDRLRLTGTVVVPSTSGPDLNAAPVLSPRHTASSKQAVPALSTPRRGWRFPAAATTTELCAKCGKAVYAAERLSPVSGLVWHAACFRCDQCSCKLTIQSSELGDEGGVPLCKAHFAQRRSAAGGCAACSRVLSPREAGPGSGGGSAASAPGTSGAHKPEAEAGASGLSSAAVAAHEATNRMIMEHRRAWGGGHCVRCNRAVYAMERQLARTHRGDELVYHKACFRCEDCRTLLRTDNWEMYGDAEALEAGAGALVCRVHFAARVQLEALS
jgi:hypothetical protein